MRLGYVLRLWMYFCVFSIFVRKYRNATVCVHGVCFRAVILHDAWVHAQTFACKRRHTFFGYMHFSYWLVFYVGCLIFRRKSDKFFFVARLSKSLATLTLGSSKINQRCWRFHGSGVIAAPQIIGLISFCTGMHHEYFFEVVNVLSCSPFMFENTENEKLIDG